MCSQSAVGSRFCQCGEFNAETGRHYTNLGFGLGTNTGGLAISGNWARSDHDGDVLGLGLGFNLPVGPMTATVGAKGIYMSPEDGSSGGAVAIGGGLSYPINKSFSVYGEGISHRKS